MTKLFVSLFTFCLLFVTLQASLSETFARTVCHPFTLKIERSLNSILPGGPDSYKLVRIFKGFGSSLRKKLEESGPVSFAEFDFDGFMKTVIAPKLETFKKENVKFSGTFSNWDALVEATRSLLELGFADYDTMQNSKSNSAPSTPVLQMPPQPQKLEEKASLDASAINPFASGFNGFNPFDGFSVSQSSPPMNFGSLSPMSSFDFDSISGFHQSIFSQLPEFQPKIDEMLSSVMPFLFSPTQQPVEHFDEPMDFGLPLTAPPHQPPQQPSETHQSTATWPVDLFLLNLTQRLGQSFLPANDIIFSHESFEPVIALLRPLGEKILEAADMNRLRFEGSFDEVMRVLREFYNLQVYVPFRQIAGLEGSDFELLHDVVILKGNLFSDICGSVLNEYYHQVPQKSTTKEFADLRNEQDYIRLATRVGIDINAPEELFSAENARKLTNLGIDLEDPGFHSFIYDIIQLHGRRRQNDDEEDLVVENDQNRRPVSLRSPVSPSRSSPSRRPLTAEQVLRTDFDSRRAKKNTQVVSRLRQLVKRRILFKEGLKMTLAKVVSSPALQESYANVICSALEQFVDDSTEYNMVPLGASVPLPAQISMATLITEACQDFDQNTTGRPSYGSEVAKEAADWISLKMFLADSKSKAVEQWKLSHSADAETPSLETTPQLSPLQPSPVSPLKGRSPTKKASFGPDQVCNFVWDSFPNSIGGHSGAKVASVGDEDDGSSALIPPFPFSGSDDEALLENSAHLADTAEYLREHGNPPELKLKRRKKSVIKAVSSQLQRGFPDLDSSIQEQISQIYAEALDETLPS